MSGFSDPIVGGIGTLIRQYIRSANYVPGASGWTINQDGTAEFQDVTIRADLSGSTLTIPAGAGPTDERIVIDNTGLKAYASGGALVTEIIPGSLSTVPAPLATNYLTGLTYPNHTVDLESNGVTIIDLTNQFTDGLDFLFNSVNGLSVVTNGLPNIGAGIPARFQFGAGLLGAYCFEQDTFNLSIPNNTTTPVSSTSQQYILSNYLSGFSGGLFTCPATGIYTFQFYIDLVSFLTGHRLITDILQNGTIMARSDNTIDTSSGTAQSVFAQFYCNQGDSISFEVFQNTGSTISSNGFISARRCL